MNNLNTMKLPDPIGGGLRLPLLLKPVLVYIRFPLGLLLIFMLLVFNSAIAKPYLPENGSQVIEYLPKKLSVFSNQIEAIKQENLFHTKNSTSLQTQSEEQRTAQVREQRINAFMQEARTTGDMRYVSYAQKQLEQWLLESPDSENARLIDAQILQYNHQFDAAIETLKSLLSDYPENNKAWSLLANLQLLTGNYPSARDSCKRLLLISSLTDSVICQSNIMIRTGSLQTAYKLLEALLPGNTKLPVKQQLWLYTSLAEIKIQQGDNYTAEQYLGSAMQLADNNKIHDSYLLRLYIDQLVINDDFDKAYDITSVALEKNKNDTGLMIRSAVLAKALGNYTAFNNSKQALTQTFDVEKRRDQSRHLREHALFTLIVLDKPAEALTLAKQNWAKQKEAEDARILMKAAVLLDDKSLLRQVRASISKTGLVDHRLDVTNLRNSVL